MYRAAVSAPRALDVTLGFYEIWNNRLYNSSLYVTLGEGEPAVRHVHRKVFLPTYGLFDEERFVERGRDVRAFDTPWGRAGMLVCEDAWHSMTATIAALDGAQIMFVCAAPPARGPWLKGDGIPGPASVSRWDRLVRDIADEHGVFVALTTLVGSEGGKTFPGGSMVAGPKGDVVGRAPIWEDAILSVSVDLADITRARADMPLVADLETMIPHLSASIDDVMARKPVVCEYDPPAPRGTPPRASRSVAAAPETPRPGVVRVVAAPTARENGPGPLDHRPRAHRAVARPLHSRRDAAPRIRLRHRRCVRRRRLGRHGLSRGESPRPEQGRRRPDAVSHVESRESRPRAARDRRAGNRERARSTSEPRSTATCRTSPTPTTRGAAT